MPSGLADAAKLDPNWILRVLVWGARALRHIGGKNLVRKVRGRASLGMLARLHLDVVHRVRQLATHASVSSSEHDPHFIRQAVELCTACRISMSDFLELAENELHVCWKVLPANGDEAVMGPGGAHEGRDPLQNLEVETLARSEPCDWRENDAHPVARNSVWSALLGGSDGLRNWRTPFSCFSCPNLLKRVDQFRCSRRDWHAFYRSTLVMPIRYPKDLVGRKHRIIGFLAFDSPRADAFGALPDIFDHCDEPWRYNDVMSFHATFHLGAIMADCIAIGMRPFYDSWLPWKGSGNV